MLAGLGDVSWTCEKGVVPVSVIQGSWAATRVRALLTAAWKVERTSALSAGP